MTKEKNAIYDDGLIDRKTSTNISSEAILILDDFARFITQRVKTCATVRRLKRSLLELYEYLNKRNFVEEDFFLIASNDLIKLRNRLKADKDYIELNRKVYSYYSVAFERFIEFRQLCEESEVIAQNDDDSSSIKIDDEDDDLTAPKTLTNISPEANLALDDFARYMTQRGQVASTVRYYRRLLIDLHEYLKARNFIEGEIFLLNLNDLLDLQNRLNVDQDFIEFNKKRFSHYLIPVRRLIEFRRSCVETDGNLTPNDSSAGASLWEQTEAKETEDCAKVLQYIRENYSRGFSFEPATISLVEQELGVSFSARLQSELQGRMIRRADDTWILADAIADEDATRQIREEVQGFLKEFDCFEWEEIYRRYSKFLNAQSIRNSSDFESWLYALWRPETLEYIMIKGYRMGRRKGGGTTIESLENSLVETIRSRVRENYGTLEEGEITTRFAAFSLEFLKKLVQSESDDLFIREINEVLCIQNFEGLGISDDFSETLAETLDELDALELEPNLKAIHVLLSSKTGENVRNRYGIPDDKSFRKLVEVYYQGAEKRRWKKSVFGKEED